MSFPKIKITESGIALLIRVMAGERVEFTHFALGSGECGNADDWKGLTNPIKHEMDVEFTKFQRDGNIVNLGGEFPNSSVETPFWWRELAIYATLPDVPDSGEVMCFYGNAEDLAEYVPGKNATVSVTHKWETSLMISGNADISAVVHSITYVTSEQLKTHINAENPHKVTAAQIGLGNVPNVATNDQQPTFTIPEKLTELKSGEKMGSAFGLIALAIKQIMEHFRNKDNPHDLTVDKIGGSPKNHRHTGTVYGMANDEYFGHTKITDDATSESGAKDGFSASPAFVRNFAKILKYAGSSTPGGSATSAEKLRVERTLKVNLESEDGAKFDGSKDATIGVDGVLPVEKGGIGADNGQDGLKNLFAGGIWQLSENQIVQELPDATEFPDGTCMLLLVQEIN